MTFMVLDLEVENWDYHGDLASPWHPLNYIVAPAFALDNGPVQSWYFHSRAEADGSDWFRIPDSVQYLVAHNAQFEVNWLLHRHREEFENFLRRGGRVLCTQLAEYVLSDQTHLYPALDEVAPKYGGTHKIDAVKLMWEQGKKTSEIDKDLLLEYLAGPEGDIENTRRAVFGQIPALQERGLWDVFLVRCDALLYSAYCKFFGMKVDLQRMQEDGDALAEKIRDLREKLVQYLPADLPDPAQFNWGSDYHLSALLFGGPIKFKVKVPYDPPKFEKVDCYRLSDAFDARDYHDTIYEDSDAWYRDSSGEYITVRYFEHLGMSSREVVCYASGKNKGQPKVFSINSTVQKMKWGEEVYVAPGITPLHDLPPDVQKEFTDPRGEFRGKRYLCDRVEVWSPDGQKLLAVTCEGTPVYSTSSDALALVKEHTQHPLLDLLTELADAEKIHGTYYVGMAKQIDELGFLRRGINHCSTVTGRLSSGLQQMPRDGDVKRMFCSRFEGGAVIECDYTALEVVHLAALSGDKALLAALQAGTDMHTLRLSAKLQRPYEELMAILEDKEHPEYKSIKDQRQDIKAPSFQYQYGGTAQGMAFKIKGMTVQDAEAFIANENALFPESSQFRYQVLEEVEARAPDTPAQREQLPDGRWQVYRRSYYVAPSGTRYSFRQFPKTEWVDGRKVQVMQFKIPQLANYPNQGEASLVMQTGTGLIIRWLIAERFYNDTVLPISTVHDAVYLDTIPERTQMAGLHTKALMEYAPKYMASLFPGYQCLLDIPYPAVPEAGPNMKDKKEIH